MKLRINKNIRMIMYYTYINDEIIILPVFKYN